MSSRPRIRQSTTGDGCQNVIGWKKKVTDEALLTMHDTGVDIGDIHVTLKKIESDERRRNDSDLGFFLHAKIQWTDIILNSFSIFIFDIR